MKTGLLVGCRYQSDDFSDYKRFGGPLVATKQVGREGDQKQTTTLSTVSYEPLADSLFEPPAAVKALLK